MRDFLFKRAVSRFEFLVMIVAIGIFGGTEFHVGWFILIPLYWGICDYFSLGKRPMINSTREKLAKVLSVKLGEFLIPGAPFDEAVEDIITALPGMVELEWETERNHILV